MTVLFCFDLLLLMICTPSTVVKHLLFSMLSESVCTKNGKTTDEKLIYLAMNIHTFIRLMDGKKQKDRQTEIQYVQYQQYVICPGND